MRIRLTVFTWRATISVTAKDVINDKNARAVCLDALWQIVPSKPTIAKFCQTVLYAIASRQSREWRAFGATASTDPVAFA
jgi:hypothetical protein